MKLLSLLAIVLIASGGAAAGAEETNVIYQVAEQGALPRLATAPSGLLHVVFEHTDDRAKSEIFYTQSNDSGQHWSTALNISKTPGSSTHPDIAVESNGAVDIVWLDTRVGETHPDIFVSHSGDQGQTWSEPLDISNTPGISSEPKIAAAPDGSLHVIWVDTTSGPTRPDVFYSSSADGAKTWSRAEMISDTPGVSSRPTIATDAESHIHVAWKDTTSGVTRPDIFYMEKVGGKWTRPPLDVSNSARISDFPSIDCGKDKIFIAWSDNSRKEKSPDIWCSVAGRNRNFSKPLNVSNSPGVSSEPSVSPDNAGRMAVVWADTSWRSGNKADIFARLSLDSLNDVSNIINCSRARGNCLHPDVSLCRDKFFVIWQEDDAGKSSIKLSSRELKNIATGPTPEVDQTIRAIPSNSR